MSILRFRPRSVERLLAIAGVVLLFLPKINLIQVGSESAGIRIDDLVLLLILTLLAAGVTLSFRYTLSKIEVLLVCLVTESLLSNALNVLVYHRSSPLYSFRVLEYFLFFYLGYYFSMRGSLTKLATYVLAINGIVMVLQKAGLVGGFASAGYQHDSSDRAIGLTGGPWEVGAIINFCFAILLFDREKEKTVRQAMVLFAVTFAILLLTGARMPTLAHMFVLLAFFYRRSKNAPKFVLTAAVLISLMVAALAVIPNPLVARSSGLMSWSNVEALRTAYVNTPDNATADYFGDLPEIQEGSDFSWIVRTAKWCVAVKIWLHNLTTVSLGVGPGALGIALDGGWLRTLSETGVVGIVLFLLLFKEIAALGAQTKYVVACLFISMVMIDINIAYKAMSFLFFCSGYLYHASDEAGSVHLSWQLRPTRPRGLRSAGAL